MKKNFSFDFAHAYKVFNAYPKTPIEACPCCINDETIYNLSNLPVESLSAQDISVFLQNAIVTFGTKKDLARLMPRIMEITAQGSFSERAFLLENLKNALLQADLLSWPLEQADLIKEYLIAYFYYEPDNTILATLLIDLGFKRTSWPDSALDKKMLDFILVLLTTMIEKEDYNEEFITSIYILNYLERPEVIEATKKTLMSSSESIKSLAYFAHHFSIVHTLFYQALLDPVLIQALENYFYTLPESSSESSYIADALELLSIQLKSK